MTQANDGLNTPNENAKPSRRLALALIAGAVPTLAATSMIANASQSPSPEYLHCRAQYFRWSGLVNAKWPKDENWPKETTIYDAYENRVDAAQEDYSSSLDALIALPPSKQKLFELLSIAAIESMGGHLAGQEREFLSAEQALTAAMQTFEALGEFA